MPARRPASYTTFAVLNFILGGFGLICSVCAGIEPSLQINNRDVTPELHAYLAQEISGYMTWRITGLVVGLLISAGLIAGGVGLLVGPRWGRIVALACSGLGILHHVLLAIFQMAFVSPAITRFMTGRVAFGGLFAVVPKTQLVMAGIWEVAVAIYFVVQILVLTLTPPRPARAYEAEDDYDDRPRRPRRRREDDDYDDEPPRRPRRRRDDWDDDER